MAFVLTEEERRDAAKIAARRAREADRVQRMIHDPFMRQVGVPLQALEQQIKEKEEARRLAANQAEEELEQQRRLDALLEQQELERREREKQKQAQLQASWQTASTVKREMREKEQKRGKGAGNGLRFVGEDPLKGERRKMQQLQMQRWIAQQQAMKAQENEKKANADHKYLRGLAALNDLAEKAEKDKQDRARLQAEQVRNENLLAARMRRENSSRERKRALQNSGAGLVTGSDKGVTGVGAEFRGLTPAQRRAIAEENARLVEEARQRKQQEREEREAYGRMLRQQATYAERAAVEENEARRRQQAQLTEVLRQQRMEAEEQRRRDHRANKQNGFQGGFFDGFGKTSR